VSERNDSRAGVPHIEHLREFRMPDRRRLLIDRRSIGFICEAKAADFGGEDVTVVAFKTQAKPIPVLAKYDEISRWWHGGPSTATKQTDMRGAA
jgi:hypothetical protein